MPKSKVYRVVVSQYVHDALNIEAIKQHKSKSDILTELVSKHLSPESQNALNAIYARTTLPPQHLESKPKKPKTTTTKATTRVPLSENREAQTEAFQLYRDTDLSVKKIAKQVGYPESTLRSFYEPLWESGDLPKRSPRRRAT